MSKDQFKQSMNKSYKVGYAKPPKEHRFKPGQSGNPKGRPKGARNKPAALTDDSFRAILLEEAHRPIKVRDGGQVSSLPLLQGVLRSLSHNAAKGNLRAQKLFLDAVGSAEEARANEHINRLATAIQYKEEWESVLEQRRLRGIDLPDPVPHPDDIVIDPETSEVHLCGPLTKEQKENSDWFYDKLDSFQEQLEELRSELAGNFDEDLREQIQFDIDKVQLMKNKHEAHIERFASRARSIKRKQ